MFSEIKSPYFDLYDVVSGIVWTSESEKEPVDSCMLHATAGDIPIEKAKFFVKLALVGLLI